MLSKRGQWGPQGHKFQLFRFRTESLAQRFNRLTPIGSFLWWTRIDSLPQLFNVPETIVGTEKRRPDVAD